MNRLHFYLLAASLLLPAPAAADIEGLSAEPGMYLAQTSGFRRIEGQVISFARTGSRLASTVTLGIKSAKINAQILGKSAAVKIGEQPRFYFRSSVQGEALGGSGGDLVLVRMQQKGNRRQFEVGAAGAWRASSGLSLRHQIQCNRELVSSGLYRILPGESLAPGEYALFLFRGYELPGFIYDFTVVEDGGSQARVSAPDRHAEASHPSAARSPDVIGNHEVSVFGVTGHPTAEGFRILSVKPGTLGAQIFLNPGDLIQKIDEREVRTAGEIDTAIRSNKSGKVSVSGVTRTNLGPVTFERHATVSLQ